MGVNYYNSGSLYRRPASQNLQKTGKLTLRKEIFSDFFSHWFFTTIFIFKFGKIVAGIGSAWRQVSNAMPANGTAGTTFSNPFGGSTTAYSELRYNYILLASDLKTGGLAVNDVLKSIGFSVSGSTTRTYNGLTTAVKHTTAASLTAFEVTV
jgi:hypothetical protein